MKFIDLTGKSFGKLKVIKFTEYRGGQPYWLCECDCGKLFDARSSRIQNSTTKDCGHYSKEKYDYCRGINNPQWKGEKCGRVRLHKWVREQKKLPVVCQFCLAKKPLDLASKTYKYKREIEDWLWLCRGCHIRYDKKWVWKNSVWNKKCPICKVLMEVTENNFYKRKDRNAWVTECKKCSNDEGKRKRGTLVSQS